MITQNFVTAVLLQPIREGRIVLEKCNAFTSAEASSGIKFMQSLR
jgi:hypothetical protein